MRLFGKGLVVVFAMIGVMASVQHLRGQGASPLDGAAFGHVGIMVTDIDATTKLFAEVFGTPPAKAIEVGPLPLVPGTPNAADSKVKFAQTKVGNLVVEFIQPVAGPGPHADHVKNFGQGLQHLAFNVKDPAATIAYLQTKGGKLTMANYVDMKDSLGFTFEIAGMPKPAAD